jgi:hypothetical protein
MILCTAATRTRAAQPSVPTWPKGTRTFDLSARYALGIGWTDEHIPSAAVAVHKFFFDNFSLGAELSGYGFVQTADDAAGVGIAAILRHHVIDLGGSTIYIDASFGPMQASNRVPKGGTNFNFTTRTGIGVAHRLSNECHLLSGVRWFHLSNAQYQGKSRNPGINGIEWYVGLGWEW